MSGPRAGLLAKLLAPWGALVALLIIATATTSTLGLRVWPIGETRNWLWILQNGPGTEAANVFWSIDSRNPLSPWWYIALRPLFENVEQAFMLLQLMMGPVLGLSVYLLVDELAEGRARLLAVGAAILASLTLANADMGGVAWNFVGALSASVLTVWTYLRAVRSLDHKRLWFYASLGFWFIAIATYALQCGAIIAIGFLTLLFLADSQPWLRRILLSGLATLPYFAVFAAFIVWWRAHDLGVLNVPLHPSLGAFADALAAGFGRPTSYDAYWLWTRDLPTLAIVAFFLFPAAVTGLVLRSVADEVSDRSFSVRTLATLALVAVSIVAPTVALETSSSTWVPGTRWPMLTQFWMPMLAVLTLGSVLAFAKNGTAQRSAFIAAVSLLAGAATLTYAGMNTRLVAFTVAEREFFVAFQDIISEDRELGREFPRHYVISRSDLTTRVPPDGFTARSYADTALRGLPPVTYRYVSPADPVRFGPRTVSNVSMFYKEVPYSRVEMLSWDGRRFTRLPIVRPASTL